MSYPIRIVMRPAFTAVGLRVTVPRKEQLGTAVREAWRRLQERKREISLIRDGHITYGFSPPNYKGNPGPFDFYVAFEVERIERLPHGMVHLRLPARQYAEVEYRGQMNRAYEAYNRTTQWLKENGYEYDDTEYYYEVYDEQTQLLDSADTANGMKVLSPVKLSAGLAEPAISALAAARIGYMYVTARDLEASIRFYSQTLGLTLRMRFEDRLGPLRADGRGSAIAVLNFPGQLSAALLLVESDDHVPAHLHKNGRPFPIAAINCPDLQRTRLQLLDAGCEASDIVTLGQGEAKYFTFRDPDGNLLEAAWSIWDPA